MKKLIVTLALAVIGASAFAQGEFAFNGPGARGVWVGSPNTMTFSPIAGVDVAFLFGSTSQTPLVDAIAGSTATNGSTAYSAALAWTDILTDPNFMLATNDNGGSPVLAVGSESGATGAYGYTPPGGSQGGAFAVDGTASAGSTYHIFVIGWSSAYATPQAAALAGAAVGWTQTFTYTSAAGPNPGPAGTPGSFLTASSAPALQFGVVSSTPEPTTIALAGLGGLALLGLRRRK